MNKSIFILSIAATISLLTGCSQINLTDKAEASTRVKSSPVQTASVNNSDIQYAFTQAHQHPETLLKNVINSSSKTLDVACYSLTKKDIVDSIIAAKNRGVQVRVITDKREAKNKYQAQQLSRLNTAGIPVKENSHSGLMHMKVTIVDGKILTSGSYNYTQGASIQNDENLLVIHNPSMAKVWDNEFDAMWNDTSKFEDVN